MKLFRTKSIWILLQSCLSYWQGSRRDWEEDRARAACAGQEDPKHQPQHLALHHGSWVWEKAVEVYRTMLGTISIASIIAGLLRVPSRSWSTCLLSRLFPRTGKKISWRRSNLYGRETRERTRNCVVLPWTPSCSSSSTWPGSWRGESWRAVCQSLDITRPFLK